MNKLISSTVLAGMMAWSVSQSLAAPRVHDESPAAQARLLLQDMEDAAASMSASADDLEMNASRMERAELQRESLDEIRDNVNQIGRDISRVEASNDALNGWQKQSVDEVKPIMKEIAANMESAIALYNSDRNHLWATAFPDLSKKVFTDAARVQGILGQELKLAGLREREQETANKLHNAE